MSFETVTSTMRHIVGCRGSGFKIEIFLLSSDPHDQERFSRRREASLAGRRIYVPTPEDVIITKLRWAKGGSRHKDVEDVENIMAVQGSALDLAYIRSWADRHSTRELFEQLLMASA